MKKLPFYTAIALLTGLAASTGFAKDKDNDRDRDRDRVVVVDRNAPARDKSRTIYVIEKDRPVERVVFVDRDGKYYRNVGGQRVYVRERHFDTYPSKYYHSDGRRKVTIRLPF